MAEKILFIVNPISGTGKQRHLYRMLENNLDYQKYEPEIVFTSCAGHATELSKAAVGKYKFVVAVGGDGTVNEVAQGLVNTNTIMGIIPVGSGNGLARHLNLPMIMASAIKVLNRQLVVKMDTMLLNNKLSVNVSGVGFDAIVAHKFATNGKRGPISYVKIAMSEYQNYNGSKYNLNIDGLEVYANAFMVGFANSSQFGNNAYIAPQASVTDGLIDVCIMQPFTILEVPTLSLKLFNKTIDTAHSMKTIKAKSVTLTSTEPIVGHIDGEPEMFGNTLSVSIMPSSLNMIYNNKVQRAQSDIEKEVERIFTQPFTVVKELIQNAHENITTTIFGPKKK
ncbi:MAG: YegS/Rv2252/BmrU family lipid kinase [Salinivirgaceae bacterium]|nr:YegS/Rv2252/BmrU family lipid kinase [Salinivirgaceae bacterium]